MKRFIVGQSRTQTSLLPASVDDYISEENPVRVVDAFIDNLDLKTLGFDRVEPHATGRPAYHPSTLLKLYIYGYLNRIHSSRRLEKESLRNIELMWLTEMLKPDFKTIADFRKDNGKAIQKVCTQFTSLCRELKLFTHALVAIDGSKFKAVNSRSNNFTAGAMKSRMKRAEESIAYYLAKLDKADRQEDAMPEEKSGFVKDRIVALKQKLKQLQELEKQRLASPDKQVSLTDPDARALVTRSSAIVGYNLQTAVDTENHLIAAHEVTNSLTDRTQLLPMSKKAREAMGVKDLEVIADRGYYSGKQIVACQEEGIDVLVPKTNTSNSRAEGRFSKDDFVYLKKEDEYQCPAGERLSYHFTSTEHDMNIRVYWTNVCGRCKIREQCTTSRQRRVRRWEQEDVLDEMQQKLDQHPEKMLIRKQTVEHPYGTIKCWMGSTHFLMKTLPKVSTEMSLHVLAYNMRRVMSILGVKFLIEAIQV